MQITAMCSLREEQERDGGARGGGISPSVPIHFQYSKSYNKNKKSMKN